MRTRGTATVAAAREATALISNVEGQQQRRCWAAATSIRVAQSSYQGPGPSERAVSTHIGMQCQCSATIWGGGGTTDMI